ncbi:histone-lysine N-methyltransferase PR-Set7 isoform X1 [Bactrocera neohumeralis]|uniref:histone-lysine N-methyltransferase PR-Set7 isoform X1 n=1 Tax=Bactrocera neohumeralis TaxID=98809 RepID=UPI0021660A9F|nr:histone-lysine N-methyltransferase PR-Set7 isoform X1 [Bactrocera neohumeralis]XP_050330023.1 histone-lysine N-methyltransferase PR-Set7 isoform X1 [Bactrocera neohumeralis]XP_050330026.1 histone-lysine N-methyltransferase PR-Set7 isoform X1 [Bactrocera neohumeralis]
MVRRRATKVAALTGGGARSANSNLLENGELKSTVGCTHLDEQYFASPKRKDCKIDNCLMEKLGNKEHQSEKEVKTHGKTKSSSSATGKVRAERGGIAGRTIGVPLATRSQTRTIENFFKAKTAANNAKLEETSVTRTESISCTENEEYLYDELPHYNNIQPSTPDTPCELDEDTNDSEFCSQLTEETVFGSDFLTHRSQLRDSHSSTGSACTNISNSENIFLQEPVLTLNVDKTPNQASSIKINTSLEVEPIFSSPPALTSALNGRFNQIVTLNISPCKKLNTFSCEAPNMAIVGLHEDDLVEELLPEQEKEQDIENDNDNSSCDSGVAFTTTVNRDMLLTEQNDKIVSVATDNGNKHRRKPATPHRIVCPSPIKTMPPMISPMRAAVNGRISSPSGRKLNKEHLSPRKSPRKMASANSKTRRRLNTPKELSALNNTEEAVKLLPEECAVAVNYNEPTKFIQHEINDCEKREQQQQQKCATIMNTLKQPQKLVAPKSHVVKMQTHKSKLVNGRPLATTNNNHSLKECFPVRRSVRKTKTAVNEEIMRNLERAILEERADGLKVAHFEGKGRGVVAERHFQRGEFVVEYIGDLIPLTEASAREKRYALDENAGCYMYYFRHQNQQYCIDATADTGKLGRLVNHSRNGNLITKVVVVKQRPHLILVAKDDIEPGEELTYDYGDRSKESLLHHPWLAF